LLRLSEDLPLVIEVVDSEDRIRSVLPMLDEMVSEGLVTLETVEVIAYRAPSDEPPA
jgi:PII-like signaling protein